MKKTILIIKFLALSITSFSQMENHLSEDGYNIYRSVIGVDTSYYCNSSTLISFLPNIGFQSLNIFDFTGDGICTISDLLILLEGYGNNYQFQFDLYDCEILGQFSSGWFMIHPLWDAIFLKPTPQDELNNDYTPEELNSFVIEGSIDNVNYKIWYYKK